MNVESPGHDEPTDVVSAAEVREAWRSPKLSSYLPGPGEHLFHEGVVLRLDGKEHVTRRRAMGRLLRQQGHKRFRDNVLFPTIDAALREALARPDPDGHARIDLISWAQRSSFALAGALVGFDRMDDPVIAEQVFLLMETVIAGRPSSFQVSLGGVDEQSPELRAALEARERVLVDHYRPALERRQELVRQHAAGDLDEGELPNDLLTLIALRADPRWEDPALAEREALFLLNAGVHTTSVSLYWTLRELFAWTAEDRSRAIRMTDEGFLLRAAEESMRLHPVTPGFPRKAVEAVRLSEGTQIPVGGVAIIRSGPANLDPSVWGEDAAEFNPDRPVPTGSDPFGFAFGTGPHLCYGMPLVVGNEGIDGSLLYFLKKLVDAGIQPELPEDPEAVRAARGIHVREPAEYPVRLERGRGEPR